MKKRYLILLFIFVNLLACKENAPEKTIDNNEKKELLFYKKREDINKKIIPDKILKKNKNFKNLVNGFNKKKYSKEELTDKVKQNISYAHSLTFNIKKTILDTIAIKSRFVLTELHLKKLQFLLKKNKVDKDTIEKSLQQVITDINKIIYLLSVYNNNTDEFEKILKYDSLTHNNINKNHNFKNKSTKIKIR